MNDMRKLINLVEGEIVDLSKKDQDNEPSYTDAEKYNLAVKKQQGYTNTKESIFLEIVELVNDFYNEFIQNIPVMADNDLYDFNIKDLPRRDRPRILTVKKDDGRFDMEIFFPPNKWKRIGSYFDTIQDTVRLNTKYNVNIDPEDDRILIVTGRFERKNETK